MSAATYHTYPEMQSTYTSTYTVRLHCNNINYCHTCMYFSKRTENTNPSENMPLIGVDILISVAGTAKSILDWVCDHLEKLKEADKVVKRIYEFAEYIQDELKKIEVNTNDYCRNRDATESDRANVMCEPKLLGRVAKRSEVCIENIFRYLITIRHKIKS